MPRPVTPIEVRIPLQIGIGICGGVFASSLVWVLIAYQFESHGWAAAEIVGFLSFFVTAPVIGGCAYSKNFEIRTAAWLAGGMGLGNILMAILAGGLAVGTVLTGSGAILGFVAAIIGYRENVE